MDNTQSMFSAIEDNDIDKVAEILGSEPQLVHQRDGQGWTPLMVAAYFGHDGLVILLLGHGARLEDVHSRVGGTALIAAVQGNRVSTSELLLQSGADPNHVKSNGFTPLLIAVQMKSLPLASL